MFVTRQDRITDEQIHRKTRWCAVGEKESTALEYEHIPPDHCREATDRLTDVT